MDPGRTESRPERIDSALVAARTEVGRTEAGRTDAAREGERRVSGLVMVGARTDWARLVDGALIEPATDALRETLSGMSGSYVVTMGMGLAYEREGSS